jgi:hypothetical protein
LNDWIFNIRDASFNIFSWSFPTNYAAADLTSLMLQVSLAARQLINALLQRDPASRLGSNTGANEIKEHPFFCGIKWPLIRCMVIVLQFFNE